MKLKVFLLLVSICLNAIDFTVGAYNVKNLFDLKYDGTEYKEFIPSKSNWDEEKLQIKLKNISKIINDSDVDILALQEIESQEALDYLLSKILTYKYSYFYKKNTSSIGLAIISKYKINKNEIITVDKGNPKSRDILKTTISVDNFNLVIFNNHWKSKRTAESTRIPYALSLIKYLNGLKSGIDYILLGDFNSNYNEMKTFKYNKRLNDTYNITGINQILNTTLNKKMVTKDILISLEKNVHYNLWLEVLHQNRFSYIFQSNKVTPDNIILPYSLFDDHGISYINKSFKNFTPSYVYNNYKTINGTYSDHLLIYAKFSTNKRYKHIKRPIENKLSYLYTIEDIYNPIKINSVTVIYKIKEKGLIVKNKIGRSVFVYKNSNQLKLNNTYNFDVNQIDRFNGMLEIKKISNVQLVKNNETSTINNMFTNGNKIDLFDLEYQNEIIKNIQGIFKNGYFYYKKNNKKMRIKLYSKNKNNLPKKNKKIKILSGHLSIFRSEIQIVIYNKNDYEYI